MRIQDNFQYFNFDIYYDLQEQIRTATNKYKWFVLAEDGIVEFYVDHHMLSTFRQCEAMFVEGMLHNIGGKGRFWSLEFGAFIHRCMEWFYDAHNAAWTGTWKFKSGLELTKNQSGWLTLCKRIWELMDMDSFKDTASQYKKIGGWQGAMLLLCEYYQVYGGNMDRIRVIGSELGFGRAKEVPLLKEPTPRLPFRVYYCGRIDQIIDNGHVIGPMDTKTTSRFDGSEGSDYKPHEGMAGYVYAVRSMLGDKFAKEGKLCDTITVNHISLQAGKNPYDRFKRSFKSWTANELEEWRLRQIETVKAIWDIMIEGRPPIWNTQLCANMYFHDCPYKMVHERAPESRAAIIASHYAIRDPWEPYKNEQNPEYSDDKL